MPGDLEVTGGTGNLDKQLFQPPAGEVDPAKGPAERAPLQLHEVTGRLEIGSAQFREDADDRFQSHRETHSAGGLVTVWRHLFAPGKERSHCWLFIRRTFRSINGIGLYFRGWSGGMPHPGGQARTGKEELLSCADTIE